MPWLNKRSLKKEIMDLESPPPEEIFRAYRLIARVNHLLGGTRVVLIHLKKFAKGWKPGEKIRILDVGTGACDIPKTIVRWARKRGFKITVTALDISEQSLAFARKEIPGYPEVHLIQASVFHLPFKPESFNYVTSSLFFHHLADAQIPSVLRSFDRAAQSGFVINDLLRRVRAFLWISFFALWTGNRVFRYDAPLSVLRGFKEKEIESFLKTAGLSYPKFHYHFGHRFALAGEKQRCQTPGSDTGV